MALPPAPALAGCSVGGAMTTKQTARRLIENRIRERAQTASRLEILEAGCGRAWPFDLSGIDYHITGIDLDGDALEVRRNTRKDLDVAVVGDLQNASFPPRSFD